MNCQSKCQNMENTTFLASSVARGGGGLQPPLSTDVIAFPKTVCLHWIRLFWNVYLTGANELPIKNAELGKYHVFSSSKTVFCTGLD